MARGRAGSPRTRPSLDLEREPLALAGLALLVLKLVLVLVVFDPASDDAFSLPKAAAGRAVSALLAAVLLGLTLRYGGRIWRWSPLYLPAAVYLALNALAVPFALDRTLALWGAPIRLLGLATLLDGAFTMVATAVLVRTSRDLRILGMGLFASAVVVIAYAALQIAGLDPVTYSNPSLASTIGNPGQLGAFLAIVATIATAVLVRSRRALGVAAGAALLALALASTLTILATGSRAALLALAAGLLTTAAFAVGLRGRRAAIAMTSSVLAAGALLILFALSPFGERFRALVTTGDPERQTIWAVGIRLVATHPVLGIGPDNYAAGFPALRPESSLAVVGTATLESSAHSWLLQAAIGSGIPGALALVVVTVMALALGVRAAERAPVAAAVVAGLVAFLAQALVAPDQIALQMLFWMALGVTASSHRLEPAPVPAELPQRKQGRADPRRSRGFDLVDVVSAGAIVLAAFAAATAWSAVDASHEAAASLALGAAGRERDALASASRAVQLDQGRAAYWAALGRAQLSVSDARAALGSFVRAASLAPYLSGHWRNVANVRLALSSSDPSQLPPAADASRRAIAAQAVDPQAHLIHARVLLAQGDRDGAMREAERTIQLAPETRDSHETLGVLLAQIGRFAEAEDVARSGLMVEDPSSIPLKHLLAQLYLRRGAVAEAEQIVPPPRADTIHACGQRCYAVEFTSLDELARDGPGSALLRTNYLIGGETVPASVTLDLGPSGATVILRWPAGARIPPEDSEVVVRDVKNALGMTMRPNTVTFRLPLSR